MQQQNLCAVDGSYKWSKYRKQVKPLRVHVYHMLDPRLRGHPERICRSIVGARSYGVLRTNSVSWTEQETQQVGLPMQNL